MTDGSSENSTPQPGPLEPVLGPLEPVLGALTPPPGGPTPPPGGPTPPPGSQYQPLVREPRVSNTIGNIALIAAILGFCCLPFIGGVLGIAMGRVGMDRAQRGLATNGGVAQAGFWLGVVGLVLTAVGFVVTIIIAAMNSTVTTTT